MDKELEDRIVSELGLKWTGEKEFNADLVRLTIRYLESHKLTRRAEKPPENISAKDKDYLERIRERDIERRISEEKGIIGGMRAHFTIAWLLDYIDKLEGKI